MSLGEKMIYLAFATVVGGGGLVLVYRYASATYDRATAKIAAQWAPFAAQRGLQCCRARPVLSRLGGS